MKKRGRSADYEGPFSPDRQESQQEPLDTLKRARAVDVNEDLSLVVPERAWKIDLGDIINRNDYISTSVGNDQQRFNAERSSLLLCAIGQMDLHYHLLVQVLPELLVMSPCLQALALYSCHPSRPPPAESTGSLFSQNIPLVDVSNLASPIFLQLGLLHPLGGGKTPLDALVLIDGQGRRRLVVPFGWGAGKHVGEQVYGGAVKARLMGALREGVAGLERERVEAEKGEDVMVD